MGDVTTVRDRGTEVTAGRRSRYPLSPPVAATPTSGEPGAAHEPGPGLTPRDSGPGAPPPTATERARYEAEGLPDLTAGSTEVFLDIRTDPP